MRYKKQEPKAPPLPTPEMLEYRRERQKRTAKWEKQRQRMLRECRAALDAWWEKQTTNEFGFQRFGRRRAG